MTARQLVTIVNVVFMFAFSIQVVKAQHGVITGKVVGAKSKSPVQDVNVVLDNINGTYTDQDGVFVIRNLDKKVYNLVFYYLGYHSNVYGEVTVPGSESVINIGTIELTEKIIQIQEVAIVDVSEKSNIASRGTSNFVAKAELIQAQPIATEEILKNVPGLNVSGDMGISNRLNVGIRGSYPRRSAAILVMEDGTPIAPAQYLAPEVYYNPPADRLDGIEVIKGADMLVHGSNTMYGLINYITKRPPVKPVLHFHLTGGENGYLSQYVTYGGTWSNMGAEFQILHKDFDGYIANSESGIFNVTTKIHSELNKKQSIYLKTNFHREKSKATYAGITPYTFRLDPKQNPFDADDLLTSRYAVDIIHNYSPSAKVVFSSKLYASQFQREWWRQNTRIIKALDARSYLGESIFSSRYSYLEQGLGGTEDYVRVGTINSFGNENSRARHRMFKVGGVQEKVKIEWKAGQVKNETEAGVRYHAEDFLNQEYTNDSSRFARSGPIVRDDKYLLSSVSGYFKNDFSFGLFTLTPLVRYESISMYKFDRMLIAKNTSNDGSKFFGSQKNTFDDLTPGVTATYKVFKSEPQRLSLYGGIYKGYRAPTFGFGFLKIEDGIVSQPGATDEVNMKPETSLNMDGGIRFYGMKHTLYGQVAGFNNTVKNFYSAGQSEAFQSLGEVKINGLEIAITKDLIKSTERMGKQLKLTTFVTMMGSRITGGALTDSDLFKAVHTDQTKKEIIDRINANPQGYTVKGANDSLMNGPLQTGDFALIKKLVFNFGSEGISDNSAPYIPSVIWNSGLSYSNKGIQCGVLFNYVGSQFTDYLNLDAETADGAMGKLDAYNTIDVNASYSFSRKSSSTFKGMNVFGSCKNITNEIYKASRLHRVASGIMPGGFRQFTAGVRWDI
jgi:Fe(3+) dicitrate transport protein